MCDVCDVYDVCDTCDVCDVCGVCDNCDLCDMCDGHLSCGDNYIIMLSVAKRQRLLPSLDCCSPFISLL